MTSLRFEAAFVGLHGAVTGTTLPLAGLLVGLNTLASHVRIAVCQDDHIFTLQLAY